MQLEIHSSIGVCSEFMDEDGSKKEVSVIISPIKVRMNDKGDKAQVITGCNLFNGCCNKNCFYSKLGRKS